MIVARVVGAEQVVAHLGAIPEQAQAVLRTEVSSLTEELLRLVRQNKLSGQVLNVRTGTLRRAINQQVDASADIITGRVGVKLVYAGIHEYGGTIQRKLREAKVRFRVNAKGEMMKRGNLLTFAKKGHKRVQERTVSVGAHSIQMPERSFLRSSLAEMTPVIQARLDEAMRKLVKP